MVKRNEIVDYATYEDTRDGFRAEVIKAKALRRIHIGDYLTLLFENHLTIRYQIQEVVYVPSQFPVPQSDTQHPAR